MYEILIFIISKKLGFFYAVNADSFDRVQQVVTRRMEQPAHYAITHNDTKFNNVLLNLKEAQCIIVWTP
ncbi:hypothetical protein CS542_07755 [Pedobacter sp. IW39]|nr:hypothetical protein CS542_07755 [Pedobacter sp. IW39]